MAKKQSKPNWDFKAAKDLFYEYLDKRQEKKKINLPPETIQIDDLNRKEALNRLYELTDSVIEKIYASGRPTIQLPSRTSTNIIWDEENDLLLLGKQLQEKQFHSLSSVADITRLMRVLEAVNELLVKDLHATKREIFYSDVKLFGEQKNSDKSIEDIATMLYTTRNSTHIVASAKGSCIGRLRIRDKSDIIDLEGLGSGGWTISPMLDNIEILESDAEFTALQKLDFGENTLVLY